MAFELFKKQAGVIGLGNDIVSVSKTSISFGEALSEVFIRNPYAEVYLDKVDNKVGFRPMNKTATAYKVRMDKGKGKRAYISSAKVSSLIPQGRYKAYIDRQGFIVIDVKEILGKKEAKVIGLDLERV